MPPIDLRCPICSLQFTSVPPFRHHWEGEVLNNMSDLYRVVILFATVQPDKSLEVFPGCQAFLKEHLELVEQLKLDAEQEERTGVYN